MAEFENNARAGEIAENCNETCEIANEQLNCKRSIAWDYFTLCLIENKKAICNLCSAILKLPTGSTTALFNHIKSKHLEVWKECSEKIEKRRSTNEVKNSEVKRQKNALSELEKNEIDELVMEMIAKDLRPFSCVEDHGFRKLINRLAPDYNLPCRTTVARSLAPKLYNKIKTKLMKNVSADIASKLMSSSFTTDCWKSRSGDCYISLTLHYMTNDFTIKNVTLGMEQMEESHTGKNLKKKLQEMLSEWNLLNLETLPTYFVTDNARNISNAIADGGWHHICCFAHTLQLMINDSKKDTKGVEDLLVKCRRIATHFHHSDPARRELQDTQKNICNMQKPLHLVQMVKTRWNSEYEMLERMYMLRIPLTQVLTNSTSVETLSGLEWSQIKNIINIMKPIYDATKISCGSTYPTISMVTPMLEGILHSLKNINFNNTTDEEPAKSFSINLIKALDIRFANVKNNVTYQKATFLDPRYKELFSDTEKLNKIKAELKAEILKEKSLENISDEICTSKELLNKEASPFWDFLREPHIRAQAKSDNAAQNIDQELVLYSYLPRIDPAEQSMLWWQNEKSKFPYLSSMALRYLPIPCTSVESERLFSSAGDIANEKRSSLMPQTVSSLIFLHKNL